MNFVADFMTKKKSNGTNASWEEMDYEITICLIDILNIVRNRVQFIINKLFYQLLLLVRMMSTSSVCLSFNPFQWISTECECIRVKVCGGFSHLSNIYKWMERIVIVLKWIIISCQLGNINEIKNVFVNESLEWSQLWEEEYSVGDSFDGFPGIIFLFSI